MTCDNCMNKCDNECKEINIFPKITSAFFNLTNQCNLKCVYCFVNQNSQRMTYKIALDATKFLIKNAEDTNQIPNIVFFGGEPLLEWDNIIVPLTNYIRQEYKKPFILSITSNCVLITEEKLKFMKENNIGLLFSIDGDKETQDYNRPFHNGNGNFEILKDKIPMILKYYPNMTFRATIHKDTVQHTFHNIKFAVESGYNNMFFIPNVFDEWNKEEKEILKKQIELFGDWFINNARKDKIITLNNFDKALKQIVPINQRSNNNQNRIITKNKCGLGTGISGSISADGKIYACQEMVTNDELFCIGDIYNGEDLEKRNKLSSMFNSQEVVGLNYCKDCKFDKVCDGACVANNYIKNGSLNIVPDMYCYWQQILLDEAIKVCNILGNEQNKLFKNTYFNIGSSNKAIYSTQNKPICLDECESITLEDKYYG